MEMRNEDFALELAVVPGGLWRRVALALEVRELPPEEPGQLGGP
ncbi:MAG: hypothetical protein RMK74_16785 [Myxococcales bacterium]|nr:hypothetical protein [Myxococcales bacterium]